MDKNQNHLLFTLQNIESSENCNNAEQGGDVSSYMDPSVTEDKVIIFLYLYSSLHTTIILLSF